MVIVCQIRKKCIVNYVLNILNKIFLNRTNQIRIDYIKSHEISQ